MLAACKHQHLGKQTRSGTDRPTDQFTSIGQANKPVRTLVRTYTHHFQTEPIERARGEQVALGPNFVDAATSSTTTPRTLLIKQAQGIPCVDFVLQQKQ